MSAFPLVILGASGHGREVAAVLAVAATVDSTWGAIDGFLDDSAALNAARVGATQVLGDLTYLSHRRVRALLGVGYPETKARVLRRAIKSTPDWPTLAHPHAVIGDRVLVGRGCFIQAGCILTCDITIAEFVTINCGVTISHDVRIDRLATVSPGAHIGGNVSIGEGAFVGIGAAVMQGVTLGEWSVVGAGAAVISDVPANAVVGGVPARVLKIRAPGWHVE